MFHPIVIRQETEAQCAGDEAPGQRGFHRPRPRPQVRVAPSPAHDLRQLPCVLLPSLGAAGGDCAGGGPGPAPRWPCPQRARSCLDAGPRGTAFSADSCLGARPAPQTRGADGPPPPLGCRAFGQLPCGGRGLCGWGWGRPPNRRAPDTQQRAQPCLESLGTEKHLSQPEGSRHNKFTANSFRGRGQVTIRPLPSWHRRP